MKKILLPVFIGLCLVAAFFIGKKLYLKPNIENGAYAAEFSGTGLDGKKFMLSGMKRNYILLDFWGSWCAPCRKGHPDLVKLYRDFHGKSFTDAEGFELVSIALEQNEQIWRTAISEDSLYWPHHILAEKMFKSSIATSYNVRQLPTKFLINPKGVIIAIDPSLDKVRKTLNAKLKDVESQGDK